MTNYIWFCPNFTQIWVQTTQHCLECIFLFSKDTLNWSQVTVVNEFLIKNFYLSNHPPQNITFSKYFQHSWAPNQHIRTISEGSCDPKSWSKDAEYSALPSQNIYKQFFFLLQEHFTVFWLNICSRFEHKRLLSKSSHLNSTHFHILHFIDNPMHKNIASRL